MWTSARSPPPTSGGRVGLVRHGVKRKRRPLSRHKYHNSILNNASRLGWGLTHTDTCTRHKGKTNTHINCRRLQRSFNTNKIGRGCSIMSVLFFFFLMHLINYQTKANNYNWDSHRRVSFVSLFYCGLWCWILHFWLLYAFSARAFLSYCMNDRGFLKHLRSQGKPPLENVCTCTSYVNSSPVCVCSLNRSAALV